MKPNYSIKMRKHTKTPKLRPVCDYQWIQVSPYGVFEHAIGRQQIHREDAQRMVDQFNTPSRRIFALWTKSKKIPIYKGHPDCEPGLSKTVYGWVHELKAMDTGLWARVEWTRSKANSIDGICYPYISPVWQLCKDPKSSNLRTIRLLSLGLTQNPNLPNAVIGEPLPSEGAEQIKRLRHENARLKRKLRANGTHTTAQLKTQRRLPALGKRLSAASPENPFVQKVYALIDATGKDYTECWNSVKRMHPELFLASYQS